jgi:hypothetical protein
VDARLPLANNVPEYVDQQDFVERMNNKALVYNDDFIGIASYNIFVGIYVATIFGSGFFFDLFWPERYESPSIRFAWKVCSILAVVFCLGAALGLTVRTRNHPRHRREKLTWCPRSSWQQDMRTSPGSDPNSLRNS